MAAPIISNEKAAARTNRDGLNLVLSTAHPTAKDQTSDHYHISRAPLKPH